MNSFFWESLPNDMRSGGSDFGQYYSAALAVKTDIRSCLYPEPKSAIYLQAPAFTPMVSSFLFDPDPESRKGKWHYYPQIGYPDSSYVSPRLLAIWPKLQSDFHFVSPPPVALLLSPLSFFDYTTASKIWFALMCASMFGSSFYASKITDHLFSQVTYASGIAALIPIIPIMLASRMGTNLPAGNISPLLGFLITLAAHSFLLKKDVTLGICMILLILFKGMALSWCPLLLLGRPRWKTLAIMAILTLAINLATIAVGGLELYKEFFREVLPKASIPLGNGIPGIAMSVLGIDLSFISSALHVSFSIVVYLLVFLLLRVGNQEGKTMVVAIACLTSLFNLFNPLQWSTYFTFHLLIPFSPLIIYFFYQLRPYSFKKSIFVAVAVLSVATYWSDMLIFGGNSLLKSVLEQYGAIPPILSDALRSIYLFSIFGITNILTVLILAVALVKACQLMITGGQRRTAVYTDPAAP